MNSSGDFKDVEHRTIFHDLLESSVLPPEDKTVGRLWQEAELLLAAGTVTTATTIASALVYLLLDPPRLQILLEELETALPDVTKPKTQKELEKLPYFVSCECVQRLYSSLNRVERYRPRDSSSRLRRLVSASKVLPHRSSPAWSLDNSSKRNAIQTSSFLMLTFVSDSPQYAPALDTPLSHPLCLPVVLPSRTLALKDFFLDSSLG